MTLHLQIRPFIRRLPSTSPLLPTICRRHRRRSHPYVINHPDFIAPIRDLTLCRITTSPYAFRLSHKNPFCVNRNSTSINNNSMANKEDVRSGNLKSKDEVEKGIEKSNITPPPPPPPEKPLPGDCCGSGCVRCVWDVYYEELDEYNKLHGTNSKTG